MLRGVVALFHLVRGFAQTIAESRRDAETGPRVVASPFGAARRSACDFAERFPLSTRLARKSAAAEDTSAPWERRIEAPYETGLTVLLDAVDAARRG